MSALVMLVAESRACLERIVCCSSMETSSLLVSCAFCRDEDVRGIDLVQNRNFGVEVGIVGKGVILNVADGVGCVQSIGANGADHLQRILGSAIGELDGGSVRLHSLKLAGRHGRKQCGSVGEKRIGGLLIAIHHGREDARVNAVDPGGGVPIDVLGVGIRQGAQLVA